MGTAGARGEDECLNYVYGRYGISGGGSIVGRRGDLRSPSGPPLTAAPLVRTILTAYEHVTCSAAAYAWKARCGPLFCRFHQRREVSFEHCSSGFNGTCFTVDSRARCFDSHNRYISSPKGQLQSKKVWSYLAPARGRSVMDSD